MDGNRTAGLVLIGVGVTLVVLMATDLGAGVVLLAVGLGFLLGYALRGSYGLLIPGAIVTGLGGGAVAVGQGAPDGAAAFGLGVGFLVIAVVDRLRAPGRGGWWWPLIPGGILVASSLPSLTGLPQLGPYLVPGVLVLVGLLLVFRPRRPTPSGPWTGETSPAEPPPLPPQATALPPDEPPSRDG